jgi:CRP-like cAMP-binding protein
VGAGGCGQVLVRQGQLAPHLLLLLSGYVEVRAMKPRYLERYSDSTLKPIGWMGKGDVLGITSLVEGLRDPQVQGGTVIAVTDEVTTPHFTLIRPSRVNSRTHVPQKLTRVRFLYTIPVSIFNVLFKPS